MNETQRTLAECRRLGWVCEKTETWQPSFHAQAVIDVARLAIESGELDELSEALMRQKKNPGVRKDLFGFIDVLALSVDEGLIAIQCTTRPNMGARVTKIRTQCLDEANAWICSGGRIEVWGWYRTDKKIERRNWHVKRRVVTADEVSLEKPL